MNNKINSLVIDGNETFDFISKALKTTNINDLEFRNCDFFNEDLLKLIEFKQYNRIAFIDCTFENETLINNIKTKYLSLTNNQIKNYEFIYEMNKLENLTIVSGQIDGNKINNLKNLQYLRISNSFVINIEKLFLKELKYLFIDNTNISDISFVKRLPNLKILSISEEQELKNKKIIEAIKNTVKIVFDSILETEVYFNE